MFIRYEFIGDQVLRHLPQSASWEIRFRYFDAKGDAEDMGLYLLVDGEEILLKDTYFWCQGRPDLPYRAVGEMYEEMVSVITEKIMLDPALQVIDIEKIENELLDSKYIKLWEEKGFIDITENGSW